MPELRQFYDDEIQGQSLSQGHSKDSVGISSTIRLLGAPGKCELYEIFMDQYFHMIYLQTSILNHYTFLFSFCAVLPVPIVFPLHNVPDSPGTDIPLTQVLNSFLHYNNSKAYKLTNDFY